jgi:GNAT superfamily N-acetyltransferase
VARPEDVPGLAALSRAVYGPGGSWKTPELFLHQEAFPEGQLVAEEVGDHDEGEGLLGMAVSLVMDSARWPPRTPWREVTDRGRLTTHDPSGDLLYGAGLAVHPEARGRGAARALYAAREALVERLGIEVIRAGARIPGYGAVADSMSAEEYVRDVVEGLRRDPTLSFQLRMGFRVVDIAPDYLVTDEASRRWAAIIEWRRSSVPGEPHR